MKPKGFSYAPGAKFAIAGKKNSSVSGRIANLTQEQQDHLDALRLQAQFDAEARGEVLNQEEIDRLAAIELEKSFNSSYKDKMTDQERADMEFALKLQRQEEEVVKPKQQPLSENTKLYNNPADLFSTISKDFIDPDRQYQDISKDEKIFCLTIAKEQIENDLSAINEYTKDKSLTIIDRLKQQLENQNAASSPRVYSYQGVQGEDSRFK
jgi:hypothetical protein